MNYLFQKSYLLFIAGILFAAFDIFAMSEDTLIIGCRPWDESIKSVSLGRAHLLDFMNTDHREVGETTFHHVDLNDKGTLSASKFSDFASENSQRFATIVIDWLTYHHIREDTAWIHFFTLLRPSGKLIIPMHPSLNFITNTDTTNQKTDELMEKLRERTPFSLQKYRYASDSRSQISLPCLELLDRKYESYDKMLGIASPDVYSEGRLNGNFIVATKTE